MKDKQRWQLEEDDVLCAHVKEHGVHDWHLVGLQLDRDPKSCQERWKNYLKPGIKRGPLTEEEQHLVIRLREKYGNKWKRIAAEVPGRTAKRLGKWWEVYKERLNKETKRRLQSRNAIDSEHRIVGETLQFPPTPTFSSARDLIGLTSSSGSEEDGPELNLPSKNDHYASVPEPVLTLGPAVHPVNGVTTPLCCRSAGISFELLGSALKNARDKDSVSSSKDNESSSDHINSKDLSAKDVHSVLQLIKELEASREGWALEKRKTTSRLRELKQQLETERMEKRRRKMEEIDGKVQALRKEEKLYLDKLEVEYAQLVLNLEKDFELKEAELLESWISKYRNVVHVVPDLSTSHQSVVQGSAVRSE